jgi:ankyrin repeat protein
LANYFLDHGAKANVADSNGFTPLHGAILAAQAGGGSGFDGGRSGLGAQIPSTPAGEANALPMIRRLLEAGADPNRATLWPTPGPVGDPRISPAWPGSTPMHVAAQVNSAAIVDLLCQFKGDPNKVRKDGQSPLSLAAKTDDVAVLQVMAKYGGDFTKTYNPTDEISDPIAVKTALRHQQTLLHIAALAGAADVIPYLISKGVPMNAKNAEGETALDLADDQEVFRFKARFEGGVGVIDATAVRETNTTDALKAANAIKTKPYLSGNQLKPSQG